MAKQGFEGRKKRKLRVKSKIKKIRERLRLSVFRSNRYIYGQLIDDRTGHTLVASSDRKSSQGSKTHRAKKAGEDLGREAASKGIKRVVFDRNGYQYHGRVKAFAEGARKGGLKF